VPELRLRYDQSPEYQAKQEAAKAEQAAADRKIKLKDLEVKTAEDRRNQAFDYITGTTVKSEQKFDEDGKPKTRLDVPISPEGVRDYMKGYDADVVAEKKAKEQQVIEQARQAAQAEAERNRPKWYDSPENAAEGVTDEEKAMGELGHPMFVNRILSARAKERPLSEREQAMLNMSLSMMDKIRGGDGVLVSEKKEKQPVQQRPADTVQRRSFRKGPTEFFGAGERRGF
jgi:hypothetical protein